MKKEFNFKSKDNFLVSMTFDSRDLEATEVRFDNYILKGRVFISVGKAINLEKVDEPFVIDGKEYGLICFKGLKKKVILNLNALIDELRSFDLDEKQYLMTDYYKNLLDKDVEAEYLENTSSLKLNDDIVLAIAKEYMVENKVKEKALMFLLTDAVKKYKELIDYVIKGNKVIPNRLLKEATERVITNFIESKKKPTGYITSRDDHRKILKEAAKERKEMRVLDRMVKFNADGNIEIRKTIVNPRGVVRQETYVIENK